MLKSLNNIIIFGSNKAQLITNLHRMNKIKDNDTRLNEGMTQVLHIHFSLVVIGGHPVLHRLCEGGT